MHRVEITFLGVWDTVVAIKKHDNLPFTERNPAVKILMHAVALDERRAFFRPYLHKPVPADILPTDAQPADAPVAPNELEVEYYSQYAAGRAFEPEQRQVWFTGSHSDIGGNYRTKSLRPVEGTPYDGLKEYLCHIPLFWMIERCLRPDVGIIFLKAELKRHTGDIPPQHPRTPLDRVSRNMVQCALRSEIHDTTKENLWRVLSILKPNRKTEDLRLEPGTHARADCTVALRANPSRADGIQYTPLVSFPGDGAFPQGGEYSDWNGCCLPPNWAQEIEDAFNQNPQQTGDPQQSETTAQRIRQVISRLTPRFLARPRGYRGLA